MRVAIVIPGEWHANTFSVDPRVLSGGFEAIGHTATIVCGSGSTYPEDTCAISVGGSLAEDPRWWRDQNFDLAMVYTWMHGHQNVLSGIAESGTFVVSKGDTDGLYGPRAHPRSTLVTAIGSARGPVSVARNVWLWGRRFVETREYESYAAPIIANLRRAPATVVETDIARENLFRFLDSVGASDLASRIHVIPNPSASQFMTADLSGQKERLIYAAGRWNAWEKNFGLLKSVLERYLRRDPDASVVVVGTPPERQHFRSSRRLELVGQVERTTLAEIGARARLCLLTSRSESFHLVAHEALTVGATVVGTPIPVVFDMVSRGRYGTVSRARRPASVVAALSREMQLWDEGRRDAGTIAADWRSRLAPEIVARQLLDLRG
jgi:glycosyltransferase involved in cell wall biosynthesis